MTTAPEATMTLSPMVTPGGMTARPPIQTLLLMRIGQTSSKHHAIAVGEKIVTEKNVIAIVTAKRWLNISLCHRTE